MQLNFVEEKRLPEDLMREFLEALVKEDMKTLKDLEKMSKEDLIAYIRDRLYRIEPLDLPVDNTREEPVESFLIECFEQSTKDDFKARMQDVIVKLLEEWKDKDLKQISPAEGEYIHSLAFMVEYIGPEAAYDVIHRLLERGRAAGLEIYPLDAEEQLLMALATIQTPDIFTRLWRAYWNSKYRELHSGAFYGLEKSSYEDALNELGTAIERWESYPEEFHLPTLIWNLVCDKENGIELLAKKVLTLPVRPVDKVRKALFEVGVDEAVIRRFDEYVKDGSVHLLQEKIDEALALFEQALDLDRKAGDLRGQGVTLYAMGITFVKKEDYKRAISCFEEGLEIARKAKDEEGEKSHREGLKSAIERLKLEKSGTRMKSKKKS